MVLQLPLVVAWGCDGPERAGGLAPRRNSSMVEYHRATSPGHPDITLAPPLPRSLFDLDPDVVWVMHCAEAPVPRVAADAIRRAQRLGSILALHHAGRGAALLGGLLRAGEARQVFASAREGYLRVAFHGWHDEATVARVAEWLAASG